MDPPGQVTIGFAFRQCQIGKSRSATEVQPGARQAIADEALDARETVRHQATVVIIGPSRPRPITGTEAPSPGTPATPTVRHCEQ